ncbi:MAG: sigma-54-dependent Fis family transcriptional regulator [Gammaproteobacteria bacterium]|nr:sigma-54-dependent Fis family transcriptional regulator [Gammaproteobacteria bacterium]
MKKPIALIIDDEPDIRELLEITLGRMNIDTRAAADLKHAYTLLKEQDFDLCLTDMCLPDGDGLEFVHHIQEQGIDIPIAVITAHGSAESAVQALKSGAFDFVSKPVDLQALRNMVNSALCLSNPNQGEQPDRRSRDTLIGDSRVMQEIRATITKLARSQAPVYISGESGTGKELVAHLIHDKGPRAKKNFIPVNCGAIPTDLMESELFGHKKGSFSGAIADKDGLFQVADGGTLFLDEVAELPLHMQVKLLRAIQERRIRAVGSNTETSVDIRILSATHKNLAQLVEEGSFRQDLYYRLNVIELKVPSLRDRYEDIPILAQHILEKMGQRLTTRLPTLSKQAISALNSYHFPGNVRELENILERATTLCESEQISQDILGLPTSTSGEPPRQSINPPATDSLEPGSIPLEDYLENVEKEVILNALEKTRHNKTAAAKLLGVSFRALRYKLKKLELD